MSIHDIPKSLADRFEHQITVLARLGIATKRVKHLFPLLRDISMIQATGVLPFVIVPRGMTIDRLIDAIVINGVCGRKHRLPNIPDIKPIPPKSDYLLVEVECGLRTLGLNAPDCQKVFEEKRRIPLTITEGLTLLMFYPETLAHVPSMEFLGSRALDGKIAYVDHCGLPRRAWLGSADRMKVGKPGCGFPSAQSRIK